MPDLISQSRAAQNPTLSALAATNPAYLASLITAASDLIRRDCGRDFTLCSYSEYYSGGIYIREPLRLRQFPVTEISRIAASPQPALLIQNVDATTNQRATLETTATAVRLVAVASAALTSTDLLYATYPTVAAIAGAINALGHGWVAVVRGCYANWPSADFKPLQGAVSALFGGHDLEMYSENIQPFTAWPYSAGGEWDDGFASGSGWRLDADTGELFGRLPRGQLNIRIDYTAGFAAIPQAVQEAAAQLTQDLYQASLVNSTLKKATLGDSSVELNSANNVAVTSPKVQMLLAPYKDYSKAIFR